MRLAFLSLLAGLACGVSANNNTEYEYVIVGSGAGGGTLAANLAREGHSVFLIEAGGDMGTSPLQMAPGMSDISAEAPEMSWHFFVNHYSNETQARRDSKFTYRTENGSFYHGLDPPPNAEPLGMYYPRAGTLGGCANHNAMNFALPPDADWDDFAELFGDESWNAVNMREILIALENNTYLEPGTEGHGFGGPLSSNRNNMTYVTESEGLMDFLRSAFRLHEGVKIESTEQVVELLERDINRVDSDRYAQNSIQQIPLLYDERRRRSSAQTYISETLNARNRDGLPMYPLTVSTLSLATQVLFDTQGERPKATGVEYMQGEALYSADPRFNASNSIKRGPREELERFDIPVVLDLPAVGTNLQDNYESGLTVNAAQNYTTRYSACTFDLCPDDPCLQEWEEFGTGPYGEAAASLSMIYRSSLSENENADLFMFGSPAAQFNGFWPGYSRNVVPRSYFFWSVVKMRPQSNRGTVTLRSADPQDVPEINFNFYELGADHDIAAIEEGIKHLMSIFNETGEAWAPFETVVPRPGLTVAESIRDESFSHHAACSCPMGTDAADSCVDSRFRVHGIDGLRIVDGSVFPRMPGAMPNGPTFLISWKAFETIMEDNSDN